MIGLIVRLSEMRLELDLARRKIERLQQAAPQPQEPAAAEPAPETAEPVDESPADEAAAESVEPEAAMEAVPPSGDGGQEDPAHVAARRFARLVATDIRLYNEEAVMQGRKHRDLPDRLKDQIQRGTEAFLKRYGFIDG